MFTTFLDFVWMVAAVALGVAAARYIPAIVRRLAKAASTLADREGDDG